MSIEKKVWGSYDGKECYLITLTNGKLTVSFTNYGGALVNLLVPDKNGEIKDVALGYDTLEGYVNGTSCQGALIGRYANRIGGAKFTLNGTEYQLAKNDNEVNHLHGGDVGYNKKVWDVKATGDNFVTFSYTSVDGEENYPGTLTLDVTYTLTENAVEIKYEAVSDKDTIMNFTNHTYFNLAGYDADKVLNHIVNILADKYTPVDELLIPTGEIADVKGTAFDFTSPKRIGEDMENGKLPGGYDHNYVIRRDSCGVVVCAAEVYEPATGVLMTVLTDTPGIQFFTGKSRVQQDEASPYYRSAFALEAQNYPDAPNHENFPSAVLRPGETYTQTTIYAFSVK